MVCKCRLESGGPSYCWNELITLSTKYRDLTANSQLAVTVSMKITFPLKGKKVFEIELVQICSNFNCL